MSNIIKEIEAEQLKETVDQFGDQPHHDHQEYEQDEEHEEAQQCDRNRTDDRFDNRLGDCLGAAAQGSFKARDNLMRRSDVLLERMDDRRGQLLERLLNAFRRR